METHQAMSHLDTIVNQIKKILGKHTKYNNITDVLHELNDPEYMIGGEAVHDDYNDITQEEVTRLNEMLITLRDMDKWDDATKNTVLPANYGNVVSDLSWVIWDIELKQKFPHHRFNSDLRKAGAPLLARN